MARSTFFVLALVFASVALAADVPEEEGVLVLSEDNFDEVVAGDLVLVEFYAPWCGHCKSLAPEYAKAAQALKGKAVLGKVDATEHRSLGERFDVKGYPTLKVFRQGKAFEYKGGRTESTIVSYLEKQSGPASKPLADDAAIKALAESDDVAVVCFCANKDSDVYKLFTSTANAMRDDMLFGETSDATAFGANSVPAGEDRIVMFKKFDNLRADYSGAAEADALKKWLAEESLPLLGEIGPDNYQKYMDSGNPLVWLFVNPASDDETKNAKDDLAAVAAKFRDYSFVWLDGVRYVRQMEAMGLSGKVVPSIAVDDHEGGNHWIFESAINANDVGDWMARVKSGEEPAHVKSEDVPGPENKDAAVRTLVATTLNEEVTGDNDILVEFYAPWCGHCKSLTPIYEKVGEHFKGNDNIVLAKIDATANDIPKKYNVKGFPTLLFFPAGQKGEFKSYSGGRTFDDIVSYMEKNSKTAGAASDAVDAEKEEL